MASEYNQVYDDDGKSHDLIFGAILVNPEYCDGIERILAHEWRHHWQYFHGWKYDGKNLLFGDDWTSDTAFNYFTNSKSEVDAMRFEEMYAGIHEYWKKPFYDYL
jgi:hypothetical protein